MSDMESKKLTARPAICVYLAGESRYLDGVNLSVEDATALRDSLNEALKGFEKPDTAEAEGEDDRLLLPPGFKPWPVDKGGNSLLPPSTDIAKIVMIVEPDHIKPQPHSLPVQWMDHPVPTAELFAYLPAEVKP